MSESTATLPASIVSPTDVSRLLREIESIEGFFTDSKIRKPGQSVDLPRLSKLMDQYVSQNQLNLLQQLDRETILRDLGKLHSSAPVMHISFSVDPPGNYVQKIVAWIRINIDSNVLVTVGLQPNIGAGCVVRTTNKLFDLSLREFFSGKRDYFIERLHTAVAEPDETPEPVQAASAESISTSVDTAPQTAAAQQVPAEQVAAPPTQPAEDASTEQSSASAEVSDNQSEELTQQAPQGAEQQAPQPVSPEGAAS